MLGGAMSSNIHRKIHKISKRKASYILPITIPLFYRWEREPTQESDSNLHPGLLSPNLDLCPPRDSTSLHG